MGAGERSTVLQDSRDADSAGLDAALPARAWVDVDTGQEIDPFLSCPLQDTSACSSPHHQEFLDLWKEKLKCWLCTDVTEKLTYKAIVIIKEVAALDVAFSQHRGMQMTRAWFNS